MNDSTNGGAPQPGNEPLEASASALSAPAEEAVLHKIFVGADGLRAGWSLLIFALIAGLLFGALGATIRKLHLQALVGGGQGEIPPSFGFLGEAVPFFLIFVTTWIMSKIEKRPNSVYGLGGPSPVGKFFAGLAWGVACLSLLVLALWKTGLLVVDSRLLFGTATLRYGAIWLLCFLAVGFFEEYLARGYVLFTLTRGLAGIYAALFGTRHSKALGFWTGALILSTLFGLGHGSNPGESPIGLLAAGLAGLVFSFTLWRTGSLWWAIGFHTSWDWAQSFLYGVADSGIMVQHHFLATHPRGALVMSGGTTGPEGSILVLPVLALVSCIVVFTLPRGSYGLSTAKSEVSV